MAEKMISRHQIYLFAMKCSITETNIRRIKFLQYCHDLKIHSGPMEFDVTTQPTVPHNCNSYSA